MIVFMFVRVIGVLSVGHICRNEERFGHCFREVFIHCCGRSAEGGESTDSDFEEVGVGAVCGDGADLLIVEEGNQPDVWVTLEGCAGRAIDKSLFQETRSAASIVYDRGIQDHLQSENSRS